jgi:hypothetical protein
VCFTVAAYKGSQIRDLTGQFRPTSEPILDEQPLCRQPDQRRDKPVCGAQVTCVRKHADLVDDVRLRGLADGNREHLAAHRSHIGDVDEAGVL